MPSSADGLVQDVTRAMRRRRLPAGVRGPGSRADRTGRRTRRRGHDRPGRHARAQPRWSTCARSPTAAGRPRSAAAGSSPPAGSPPTPTSWPAPTGSRSASGAPAASTRRGWWPSTPGATSRCSTCQRARGARRRPRGRRWTPAPRPPWPGSPVTTGCRSGPARVRDVLRARGADIYGNPDVTRQIYSLRAQVRRGASGGPVIDRRGDVVGMVFATSLDDAGHRLRTHPRRDRAGAAPRRARLTDRVDRASACQADGVGEPGVPPVRVRLPGCRASGCRAGCRWRGAGSAGAPAATSTASGSPEVP